MDSSLKLVGTLIVLTIVLASGFNLINSFQSYTSVKVLSNDLNNLGTVMKSLKDIGGYGSWRQVSLSIPTGYCLYFNNESNNLEVHGLEEFNITINSDVLYSLNLSNGDHALQLYYGDIQFADLKDLTVVFR